MNRSERFRQFRSLAARVPAWLAACLALGPFVYLVWFVQRYAVDVPFLDEWDMLDGLVRHRADHTLLSYLIAQHNEHRPTLTKAILFPLTIDAYRRPFVFYLGVSISLGEWLLLWVQSRRTFRALHLPLPRWLPAAAAVLVCSPVQWSNWLWTSAIGNLSVLLFAVAGFVLLGDGRPGRYAFLGAIGCGLLATYSVASGIFFWPAGFLPLWFGRSSGGARYRQLLAWTGVSFAVGVAFFADFHFPPYHPSPASSLDDPLAFVRFFLALTGAPVNYLGTTHAIYFGAIGIAGMLALLLFRDDVGPRSAGLAPWYALGLFTLLTNLAVTMGRSRFGIEFAFNSRYLSYSYPFWIVLLVLLGVFLGTIDPRHRKPMWLGRILRFGVAPAALATVLVSAGIGVSDAAAWSRAALDAKWKLHDWCAENESAFAALYPSAERVHALVPEFEKRHMLAGPERPLKAYRVVRNSSAQGGWVDAVQWKDLGGPPQRERCLTLGGWAVDVGRKMPAREVLLVHRGTIVARALLNQSRDDLARTFGSAYFAQAGWRFHVASSRLPKGVFPVDVYAVLQDGVRIQKVPRVSNLENITITRHAAR